ncbi:MAG: TonB-dependent receptor [Bacteroidaceae bacterium]|nr:TonB-dependent receptor [Bacteroidaceae bacterium]
MKKTLFLLLAALLVAAAVRADVLKGRVVDAQTGEPLDGARVEARMTSGDGTSVWMLTTDTLGRFQFESHAMRRITLRAGFFGYKPTIVQLMSGASLDTVLIDDIRLEPSEVLMRELAVKGSARRFYMRGDTVVFNPQAFPVEEGQRLQDLVLQLPGVSVQDGRLLWNGKPVRLMMNGREALSEGMLMSQLPVEAVENIKAYERRSELEEHTGVDDGRREQVLDVTVRPRFMDRWSGELRATAYSRKNYATEANGMKLSDTDPVMFFLRAADDPRAVSKKTADQFWTYGADDAIRQQMGSLAYKHAWRPDFETNRDSHWAVTAGANHSDRPHSRWERTQNFLSGTLPTETNTEERTHQHKLSTPLDFASRIEFSPKLRMQVYATLAYEQEENSTEREQETLPLSSSSYHSSSRSKGVMGTMQGKLLYLTKKGMLAGGIDAEFRHRQNHGLSLGNYHYLLSGTSALDRQHFSSPTNDLSLALQLGAQQALGKKTILTAMWTTTYNHLYRNEERWRADTLDLANSLRQCDDLWKNELELMGMFTLGKVSIGPHLTLSHLHEQSDYRRGRLDTLARRNLLLASPHVELNYRIAKQQGLKADVSYVAAPSQLIDCIGYRDDTNLLYIIEGNPGLHTSHTLAAKLYYNIMRTRGSQSLGIGLDYYHDYDPVATVLHYNSQTGGYRSRKRNVRGGSRWQGNVDYERSLGERLQMKNRLNGEWSRSYGLLTLVDDATGLIYNRQSRSYLHDRLSLAYDTEPWHVELTNEFTWNRYAYSDAAQPTQNIFHYELSMHLRYKLRKSWRFTLTPMLLLRRGYLSPSMNDTPFLLNAEVTYKFTGGRGALLRHLDNRADITLAANDLLNQDRRHASTITATSHTESGSSLLHNYVTLTLRYRWEPKK